MQRIITVALAALLVVLAACGAPQPAQQVVQHEQIAWFEGGVEEAFAQAAQDGMPLFLYWGADWCPPCHNLRNNVFTQPAFLEGIRQFVPVYLDGDTERAQLLGERFGITSYPTVILFSSAGVELYRMPTDVPPQQYGELLIAAVSEFRPVQEVLANVMQRGPADADQEDVELIAFHSWSQDPHADWSPEEARDTFWTLYVETPPELERARLRFMTLVLDSATPLLSGAEPTRRGRPRAELSAVQRSELRAGVLELLNQPDRWPENKVFLTLRARHVVSVLEPEPSPGRDELVARWRTVARELQDHPDFTASEQLYAFMPEFDLLALEATSDDPTVPASLVQKVETRVEEALAGANEPGELQTVLNMAVWLTIMAGQPEAAEALLDEHLDAAVAPHYFLSLLGDLSADRPDVALEWHRMAWERSGGGSSAVKWGAGYVEKLIELTPDDAPAVEAATRQLLEQVMASEDAFAGRNSTYLQALERALVSWAANEPGATVVSALRSDVLAQCERFENTPDAPQRERCRSFLEGVAGR